MATVVHSQLACVSGRQAVFLVCIQQGRVGGHSPVDFAAGIQQGSAEDSQ